MEYKLREVAPNTVCVQLRGHGDAAGISAIETGFTASVARSGHNILVDLADVAFMGSLGIRMLISCARVITRNGAAIALFNVPPMVMEVFDTVALSELIPIVTDEAAALARVHAGPGG